MFSYSFSELHLLVVLSTSLFFCSCSRRTPNDLYVVKSLKTGLEYSNLYIERENEAIFNSFELKRQLPETKQKAELLLPEMQRIRDVMASVIQEIENDQIDLRAEASSKNETEAFYYEDNLDAVKRLFIQNKRATYLFRKIRNYKDLLLDSVRNNADFVNNMLIDIPLNGSGAKELDNFIEFFKNQPAISVDAFLEKLKGDVLLNEKRMLSHINDRITGHYNHSLVEVLIGVNSENIRSGEELRLTAGIGDFRYFPNSYVVVNGIKILPDEKGVFSYNTKINGNPGKYKLPVEITYIEADGNTQSITKTVEYTIIK